MTEPRKLSDVIERMLQIRAERKRLSEEDSALVEEWEGLEQYVMQRLDEEGTKSVSSNLGSAIITESEVPQVEDWDAVEKYIYDNQAVHVLQRRVATGAFRELLAAGTPIPGVKPLTKRTISLTAAK
jgi:hypothetical protein